MREILYQQLLAAFQWSVGEIALNILIAAPEGVKSSPD
jgi:hypothetical protein